MVFDFGRSDKRYGSPFNRITIVYDVDAAAAASQRAKQFAGLASERRLVAAAHLPFPGIGHIRAQITGYAWVPVDYVSRDIP